ncbi:hypothetical protein E2C01_023218 [Portunus trituberculatus]|uniref:Uncharacterized protein n=1 Tax=Portunus trituberculatus TaxID=210409 RepID=A0A5B7EAZ4_PORTR|nr:hypothetical protein [Portunus trituberculatus]
MTGDFIRGAERESVLIASERRGARCGPLLERGANGSFFRRRPINGIISGTATALVVPAAIVSAIPRAHQVFLRHSSMRLFSVVNPEDPEEVELSAGTVASILEKKLSSLSDPVDDVTSA